MRRVLLVLENEFAHFRHVGEIQRFGQLERRSYMTASGTALRCFL